MSVNTRTRNTLAGRHPELTAPPLKTFGAKTARNREAIAGILFVLPTLVIFGLFKFLPIFGAGAMSLTEYSLNGDFEFLGADNYTRLAADPNFWQSLKVTFLYVAIFVPFIIGVSLAGAVLLDKLVRFTGTFRALLFIPYLSSFVMAGIIWTWIFSTDGPLNAALGGLGMGPVPFTSGPQLLVLLSLAVVSVWKGFGYSMLIFLAGLKAQPAEVHEAARIDGAGAWKSFWYVTLPLLKPVVFFVLVIETIVGFQVFDTIYVMTGGGPARASHSLIYFLFDEGFKFFDFGYASAIGVVLFVIVLILSLIQQRFFEGKESK
ncbi:multiple sugar transport system permease protein [Paenarthrobacter nicotinovorans]|uniref:Sugar ABC transporter permease n=1 Tax=Paenarthrobacter nicotinovorans TaxID=29320 RepID=A0ABV0GSX0_PAENI|nr:MULTISPECIES: sugar ABC transporter permease [Micrococcaceae]MDR6434884.1 multiple sugar transport system permease protein [Paenarthrobacter nicotinovorans]SCZ59502.1 multiple sugar transport system permease protein [Arthrobacter sp. UNCCL28]